MTTTGTVIYNGHNIYSPRTDTVELRKEIGMVFQQPNPFPMSIYDNVTYGLMINGVKDKQVLDEAVETSLKNASIWDEVKDRLHDSAIGLSGGQQQRVCVARVLATSPKIILLDEPTSALDPELVGEVEKAIAAAAQAGQTMILVSHDMSFVSQVADKVLFLDKGKIIESGTPEEIMKAPKEERTKEFFASYKRTFV